MTLAGCGDVTGRDENGGRRATNRNHARAAKRQSPPPLSLTESCQGDQGDDLCATGSRAGSAPGCLGSRWETGNGRNNCRLPETESAVAAPGRPPCTDHDKERRQRRRPRPWRGNRSTASRRTPTHLNQETSGLTSSRVGCRDGETHQSAVGTGHQGPPGNIGRPPSRGAKSPGPRRKGAPRTAPRAVPGKTPAKKVEPPSLRVETRWTPKMGPGHLIAHILNHGPDRQTLGRGKTEQRRPRLIIPGQSHQLLRLHSPNPNKLRSQRSGL